MESAFGLASFTGKRKVKKQGKDKKESKETREKRDRKEQRDRKEDTPESIRHRSRSPGRPHSPIRRPPERDVDVPRNGLKASTPSHIRTETRRLVDPADMISAYLDDSNSMAQSSIGIDFLLHQLEKGVENTKVV